MADAATEFLLNNLKELVLHEAHLIKDTKGEIENLRRDLVVFKAFLRDTVKMRKSNDTVKEVVKEIHDVVYEVEDIIEVFVTKSTERKKKSPFIRFWSSSVDLHTIGKKVEGIKGRVEQCRKDVNIDIAGLHEREDQKPEQVRIKDVVGFKDVTDKLIGRLTKDTDSFDVISLIGMFGLGKTTLAWKIYTDPDIVFKYHTRIWLSISQQFTDKDIFLQILKEFTTIDNDILSRKDHELAEIVSAYLRNGSFLIVMDDVWSADDWKRVSAALPSDNPKGKVLITSRMEEVGNAASVSGYVCKLRFFKFEESWELLQAEALGKRKCPPALIKVGEDIARDCEGLPLIVVVVGGILAASSSADSDVDAIKDAWMSVSKDMSSSIFNDQDKGNRIRKLISLSYDKLPYHLRACFLYFGLFPEDYEIPASKLIRMWIGEGFIQEKPNCTLEEIGETYLKNLIGRNLVKGVKFKPDGKVKICQIHDTLREFCRAEAESENFLQEIKYTSDGQCVPPISNLEAYRRLSVHSNCLKFIQPNLFGARVRTFVCFHKEKYSVSAGESAIILGAFKLLRVLDVLSFEFAAIDADLYKLVHMRYIALSSSELKILHPHFSKLLKVQTLIVDTTSRTLEVEADIWKMKQLRHFKTNASATLPKWTKSEEDSAKLQTLGLISVDSCTGELADRAPYLMKLGIRGKLDLLFDGKRGSFDSLRRMKKLVKLKLKNDTYPVPLKEGRLDCLPEAHRFPSGLTTLTLCGTYLSWEHMSTLGLLNKLEVLKLKDQAFMGSTWQAEDKGFHCLKFLHIDNTDLISWKASPLSYPMLKSLVLKNCEKLRGIPVELAAIPSLRTLELYTCMSAVNSAKKIRDAKIHKLGEASAFTLSMYPAPVE